MAATPTILRVRPRYDLDLTLLRVYDNDAPMHVNDYLQRSLRMGSGDSELDLSHRQPWFNWTLADCRTDGILARRTVPRTARCGMIEHCPSYSPWPRKKGLRPYEKHDLQATGTLARRSPATGAGCWTARSWRRSVHSSTIFVPASMRIPHSRPGTVAHGKAFIAAAEHASSFRSFAPQMFFYSTGGTSSLMAMAMQLVRIPVENDSNRIRPASPPIGAITSNR